MSSRGKTKSDRLIEVEARRDGDRVAYTVKHSHGPLAGIEVTITGDHLSMETP